MVTFFGPSDIVVETNEDVIGRLALFDGPLELSWHHCATTSDFIGDLFALRIHSSLAEVREARHSVGYLVNELIENAVKFRTAGEIFVEATVTKKSFKIKISNFLDGEVARRFQIFLSEITTGEPGDLLIKKIEANATHPDSSESGLGLLTLMSDYGARLAWAFRPGGQSNRVHLETYALLQIADSHVE